MLYLGGALVYWLWETTHVQEVVGLNPGMDMTFSHWFVVKFVLFVRKDENERKRGHVGPFFRDSCYIKFDNGAQLLSGLTALPTVPTTTANFYLSSTVVDYWSLFFPLIWYSSVRIELPSNFFLVSLIITGIKFKCGVENKRKKSIKSIFNSCHSNWRNSRGQLRSFNI